MVLTPLFRQPQPLYCRLVKTSPLILGLSKFIWPLSSISPDENRGYIGFNSFTDFIQTWHIHVFWSGEEPYFKVTLNSQ